MRSNGTNSAVIKAVLDQGRQDTKRQQDWTSRLVLSLKIFTKCKGGQAIAQARIAHS